MITNNSSTVGTKLIELAKAPKAKQTEAEKPTEQVSKPPVPEKTQAPEKAEIPKKTEVSKEKEVAEKAQLVDQDMRQKVEDAVKNVRDFIQKNQRSLDFEMSEKDNRVIITVIDRHTNEVIRQIPPEEVVSLSEQLKSGVADGAGGLFFKGIA